VRKGGEDKRNQVGDLHFDTGGKETKISESSAINTLLVRNFAAPLRVLGPICVTISTSRREDSQTVVPYRRS